MIPQKGYQEKTLSCPADIVFGGGAAGAGKTFELLMEPVKGFNFPGFRGVIFRRTSTQITGGGGLWDESTNLYSGMSGAKPVAGITKWVFKKKNFKNREKAELKFSHMEHEKNKYDHQGLQYAFIGFDELTHFSKGQFFYMLSRNRSVCGIKPFMRCTMNPDPESWVAEFIKWWLDDDGYIIPERDGVIRYFTIFQENPVWGDSPQDVIDQIPEYFEKFPEEERVNLIKSFTFIEGDLDENKELLKADPTYKGNLLAQDEATKKALLEKCWKPIQDDLAIVDYDALASITSNYLDPVSDWYITCDVAGYGKDLAVVKVWNGWEVVKIKVYTKCSPEELKEGIEEERLNYKIPKHKVAYDNDGLGWGIAGNDYISFNGNDPVEPIEIDGKKVKENYKNLKTQCYYSIIEKIINENLMKITEKNIWVDGVRTRDIKLNGEVKDVLKLVKEDLKAIKRHKVDDEGRRQINPKSEQKTILGRSPDFGDTIMMRYIFALKKKKIARVL